MLGLFSMRAYRQQASATPGERNSKIDAQRSNRGPVYVAQREDFSAVYLCFVKLNILLEWKEASRSLAGRSSEQRCEKKIRTNFELNIDYAHS